MTSSPIKTLDELLNWNKSNVNNNNKHIKNKRNNNVNNNNNNKMKIIHCHDMMGGYIQDNINNGYYNEKNIYNNAYNFYHWHLIDIFIYFSHYLISIPPLNWIHTSHKNGVSILGTFIVEWDNGTLILDRILESTATVERFVQQLVDIAIYYEFDGWFVNIESNLSNTQHQIPLMIHLLDTLTKTMHKKQNDSIVLWYDSLTPNGRIQWQNVLNNENKIFFDLCDGIFTNYSWSNNGPKSSVMKLCEHNEEKRCYDVYTGIDIWGRGTFGGGGMNGTPKALEIIKQAKTSCALFAPAWTCETTNYERHKYEEIMENQFWHNIAKFITPRWLPFYIPFKHSFNRGVGKAEYINGELINEHEWFHLSRQDIARCCDIINESRNTYDIAFNGGSCLEIYASYFKIFQFEPLLINNNEEEKELSLCIKIIIDNNELNWKLILYDHYNHKIELMPKSSELINNNWYEIKFNNINISNTGIKTISIKKTKNILRIGQIEIY